MTQIRRIALPLVLAVGLLVAACGGDDYGSATTTASSPTATASSPAAAGATTPATSPPAGQAIVVQVKDTATIGKVLADGDGMTLYTFNNDSVGKSSCSGGCAATWPPLTAAAGPSKPGGVIGEFSLINRDDGPKQVALDGSPLYRYAADKVPADTKGEGVGGVWFAAKAGGPAAGPTPASNASDNGY